jgi:hypothetical protein
VNEKLLLRNITPKVSSLDELNWYHRHTEWYWNGPTYPNGTPRYNNQSVARLLYTHLRGPVPETQRLRPKNNNINPWQYDNE